MADMKGVFGDAGQAGAASEYSAGGSKAVPAGKYKVVISEAEVKPCRNDGSGMMVIFQGDNDLEVKNWINLKNNGKHKELVERIGRSELAKLATVAGITDLKDSDQLIGMEVVVKLDNVENSFKNSNGETITARKNNVKGYFPVGEATGVSEETKKDAPW